MNQLQVEAKQGRLEQESTEVAVVTHFEGETGLKAEAAAFDKALGGTLLEVVKSGEFEGKIGETLVVHAQGKIPTKRLLLVGLGKRKELHLDVLRQAFGHAVKRVRQAKAAAFVAALLMVLTGCLTMDEAYASIEWRAIFLIAGMLPLGLAMASTGTAALLGSGLVDVFGGNGPLALAGGLFMVTVLLTQVMGGQAAAVVLAPIAVAAALHMNADPRAVGMAVALGCSTRFRTSRSTVSKSVRSTLNSTFRNSNSPSSASSSGVAIGTHTSGTAPSSRLWHNSVRSFRASTNPLVSRMLLITSICSLRSRNRGLL